MQATAIFKGYGKRQRKANRAVIYGQKFYIKRKVYLTEDFIRESGLDNEDTREAVVESLRTDYGLYIKVYD